MDAMQLILAIGGAGGALSAIVTLWNLLQGPTRGLSAKLATQDASIEELEKALSAATTRVSTVETVLKAMPDMASVHRLELSLEQMNTRIAGMAASAEATERTARRVEQFLLDQAKPVAAVRG